ncbi:hypothetical protein [Sphingomonas sp. IW22]|uniref:hypothetical protein n=1 Tax=Sphingomonas sp. IW22 TaxID=3242489 RepID=UPI0035203109
MSRRTPAPAAAKAPVAAAENAAPAAAPSDAQSGPSVAQTPPADAQSAAEAASAVPSAATAQRGDRIEVRVLSAFDEHVPNDVIAIDTTDLSALTDMVDADPAAVEYAKSLKA